MEDGPGSFVIDAGSNRAAIDTATGESIVARHGRRRWVPLLLLTLALATVVTACLKPDEYDPTGNEPIGRLDVIQVAGSTVRVAGWAIDPNTTSPVTVSVGFRGKIVPVTASLERPDVAAVFKGYGARHGFDFTTPTLGKGSVPVCVWVTNVGPGSRGRLLGCQTMNLASDDAVGKFESFTILPNGSGRLVGWGLEPEIPHKPTTVQWSLNDGVWNSAATSVVRADVNKALATSGPHGFSIDVPLVKGNNKVCMRVPSWGRGKGAVLGCRSVVNDVASPIAAGRDLLSVFRVGPPNGHPLQWMSRDAGVSTVLTNGSVLWFFGDSSETTTAGGLKYFVNNTSAWASRAKPYETIDAVSSAGKPVPSFTPLATPVFSPACPTGWKPVFWPLSAVTVPGPGGTDSVFVYLANVCVGNGEMKMSGRGVSVARYTYDPANPPTAQRPIVGTIIKQNLFATSDPAYGTAAVYRAGSAGSEGFIYAYQCGTPANDGLTHWPNDPGYGPCTVSRVRPSTIGDPSSYQYFIGSNTIPPDDSGNDGDDEPVAMIDDHRYWSDDRGDAGAIVIPAADPSRDKELPVAAFTIVNDPYHGYVLAYSPWPGFTNEIALRRSDSPIGPWSSQTKYKLPGCEDSLGGVLKACYAGTPQPAFSTASQVGIGYYDQLVGLNPSRGSYLAGRVTRPWPLGGP